jgi:hypothetical protein
VKAHSGVYSGLTCAAASIGDNSACASAISGISGVERQAFQRRREDGVRVRGAAGRLIEFGEREGGAQAEAARPLTPSDGDGGLQVFLGGRGGAAGPDAGAVAEVKVKAD